MLGTLSKNQIKNVLHTLLIGRIGCYAKGKVYVVPITYAYDEGYIYCHSREGLKIEMMRKNPHVCFEVDTWENMMNWRSVIAWGEFEELTIEREQERAMQILIDRIMPVLSSESARYSPHTQEKHLPEKGVKPIPFRIKIMEVTGRYEKTVIP